MILSLVAALTYFTAFPCVPRLTQAAQPVLCLLTLAVRARQSLTGPRGLPLQVAQSTVVSLLAVAAVRLCVQRHTDAVDAPEEKSQSQSLEQEKSKKKKFKWSYTFLSLFYFNLIFFSYFFIFFYFNFKYFLSKIPKKIISTFKKK